MPRKSNDGKYLRLASEQLTSFPDKKAQLLLARQARDAVPEQPLHVVDDVLVSVEDVVEEIVDAGGRVVQPLRKTRQL